MIVPIAVVRRFMSLIHACNEMLYNARSDRKKGRVGCQELGLHKSHEFVVSSLKLTAKAPENGPSQKETIVFQPSIFRCELLVSGGVSSKFRFCKH